MAADEPDDSAAERASESRSNGADERPSFIKRWWRKTWVKIAAGVVALIVLGASVLWYLNARQYADTTDAFIDAHIVYVAPQISGQVRSIAVRENQRVRAGQLLLRIDPGPMRAKYDQATAKLDQAQIALATAQSKEASAAARAEQATSDYRRYRALHHRDPAAVSPQQLEKLKAAALAAVAQRKAAKHQVAGARAAIAVAKASLATARLNLSYTRIVAPVAGHVTQRTTAVGDYVSPGEDLMAIVPLKLWVKANYKETDLEGMKPDDKATVSIDACGGATVKGHVVSIEHGAGQAFQILPPENATGNFVKVVQRVPVRIALDTLPKHCVLGPGMSVEPSVKVR